MCFDFFEFPQHKSFRGVKEFQETTKEVLELETAAARVKSSKKKGKLNAAMKRKQAQLTGAPPAPRAAAPRAAARTIPTGFPFFDGTHSTSFQEGAPA